uniref:hypothetical protein n=1 Tax=Acetobacter pasteurianus TaxID=438 RepID=UPI00159EE149|nr:hypothetical protein [Acetobacter pasteurianus]
MLVALARGALCLGGISLSQVKDSTNRPSIARTKCNKYKKILNLFLFTETFTSAFFSVRPLFTYNNVGEASIERMAVSISTKVARPRLGGSTSLGGFAA